MRYGIVVLCLVSAIACLGAHATPTAAPASERETIPLPSPRTEGPLSLEAALARRRSIRSFTDEPLTLDEIAQLLWAAQGITRDWGGRTAPSAGALYPLEVSIVTDQGAYHYVPAEHAIVTVAQDDLRPAIWEAGLKQDPLAEAPATVVITAVYERTRPRYSERAELYVHLEAGHAAQNILLQAVALDLGAVPIGAFYEDEVANALALPTDHIPLYLIPVGHPRE